MLRMLDSSRRVKGRDKDRSFHPVFLSFSEYQDGAAGGAEDRAPTQPCQKRCRLDAEHGECPGGSLQKFGGNPLLPPWPPGPKVREQLPKGEKRPELGQSSTAAMVSGLGGRDLAHGH